MMPSDPSRQPSKPELPPELKNDLPQPPDLESLLPEEGPDEMPSPPPPKSQTPKSQPPKSQPPKSTPPEKTPPPIKPAPPEATTIPDDDDPFKDDLLPSEGMGGAKHTPKPPAAINNVKTQSRPAAKTIPANEDPFREEPLPPAGSSSPGKKHSEPKAIPSAEDPFKDDPLPGGDPGDSAGPPVPPPAAIGGKMHWRPDPRLQQPGVASANKNPIVLADAQNIRQPSARPQAITATSPKVAPSRSNPLRSATSGMVLPGPMAEPDEVVPAADWTPEAAPNQAQPAATQAPTTTGQTQPVAAWSAPESSSESAPDISTVRRVNPLRGGR
jgi:hypothetical protein